jgi:hypothetical protein
MRTAAKLRTRSLAKALKTRQFSTHLAFAHPVQPLFADDEGFGGIHTMGKKSKNLSEELVSQIADRIGAQMKQKPVSATDGAVVTTGRPLMSVAGLDSRA